MKPAGQCEQAGCGEYPKRHVLRMLVRRFLCNVNDTRALIGPCVILTSRLGQILDLWYSQVFTLAHMVIGLSLHIHSFIHLRIDV